MPNKANKYAHTFFSIMYFKSVEGDIKVSKVEIWVINSRIPIFSVQLLLEFNRNFISIMAHITYQEMVGSLEKKHCNFDQCKTICGQQPLGMPISSESYW